MASGISTDRAQGSLGRPIAVAGVAVGVFAALLASGVAGAATIYVDDLGLTLAAVVAAVLCGRTARGEAGRMRRFWGLLAAACAAWALGEAIWAAYDLVLLRDVPVPSWADLGYLSAIPLAAGALLAHPSMRSRRLGPVRSVLDGLIVATALLFVSWLLVLAPMWRSSEMDGLEAAVAVAYPFGDLIVVWFVILLMRRLSGAHRSSVWLLLGGLLAMALTDSAYAYLTAVKSYEVGAVVDVGWVAAYVCIALAAIASGSSAPPSRSLERSHSLAPVVAGFAPMLVGLGAVAAHATLGSDGDVPSLVLAFGLVTLVLTRQALVLVDLRPARRRTDGAAAERLDAAISGTPGYASPRATGRAGTR